MATLGEVNLDEKHLPETATPAHQFSVRLAATRRGAHLARTLAVQQIRAWGLPFEAAAQVIAELAANAALHGRVPGRDFLLTVTVTAAATAHRDAGQALRIEVTDTRAERLPAARRNPPLESEGPAESGRGLLLVNALADRWGVTSGPVPCKTVWAELDIPDGLPRSR